MRKYLFIIPCLILLAACSGDGSHNETPSDKNTVRLYLPKELVAVDVADAVAADNENAVARLDVFVFDHDGLLEKRVVGAEIKADANSKWVDVGCGDGDRKSFYVVANPALVPALDDVQAGVTTVGMFRETQTLDMTHSFAPPLLITGFAENVDILAGNTTVAMTRRTAKVGFNNDFQFSGFAISKIYLTDINPKTHLFANATGTISAAAKTASFDYDGKQSCYITAAGGATITLEGLNGVPHVSITAVSLEANESYTYDIPEYGTGAGAKTVTLSGTKYNDYLYNITTSGLGWSAEDYSGITWLGDNKYAAITDKKDGFYIMEIDLTDKDVTPVSRSMFYGDALTSRDCEGIVYHPGRGTLFISGEADQEILEYKLDGTKTGAKLAVPAIFKANASNYGFEALAYDRTTGLFWTTTEATLPADGGPVSPVSTTRKFNYHRLQSFGEDLQPTAQYAYKSDELTAPEGSPYAFGVPEITALPDGRLLILEREFAVYGAGGALSSFVTTKIYLVDPTDGKDVTDTANISTLTDEDFLVKTQLASFRTTLLAGISNYEGMCLGPALADGTRALVMINDAQSMAQLQEYVKMMKLSYR